MTFTLRPRFYLLIKMNSEKCWEFVICKIANLLKKYFKRPYLKYLFPISRTVYKYMQRCINLKKIICKTLTPFLYNF